MTPGGCNYNELATFQVEGAGERARREVEVAQLALENGQLRRKWEKQFSYSSSTSDSMNQANNECDYDLTGCNEMDESHMEVFTDALAKAFSYDRDRELSPFMMSRLASLSCREYKTIQAHKALRRLHNDYRLVVNWLCEQMEEQEKEMYRLEHLVTLKKQEIQKLEQEKVEELRESLRQKKEELEALKKKKLQRIESREDGKDAEEKVEG